MPLSPVIVSFRDNLAAGPFSNLACQRPALAGALLARRRTHAPPSPKQSRCPNDLDRRLEPPTRARLQMGIKIAGGEPPPEASS